MAGAPLTRPFVHDINHRRSKRLALRILPHLPTRGTGLDIGAGFGCLAQILRGRRHRVAALDRNVIGRAAGGYRSSLMA